MLLNENIPASVVDGLRTLGHDILSAKESMRGVSDTVILARAQSEQRVVVTQDKDFGELAFRVGLSIACGVVLFRLSGDDLAAANRRMIEVLDSRQDWPGHFSVVTDDRIRMRATS